MRETRKPYPKAAHDRTFGAVPGPAVPEPEGQEPVPARGRWPCPCCGYKTFPVPKEDALAYLCPVCLWENDVFDPGEDRPSDENHGMTLAEGREAYKRLGAVREEFLPYAREPLPEELP
ncbi:CPCC family cysteine-rich protein [uncultured Oscillibacter sp.]|uniref:CPCC family cysteine-rich protein n=1 Tax=uncultured Oscillibacter sp. TaxID=876091 RepID=UPI0025DEFFC8|nr:CPCC family cysteine-rich protein [uncultured Oscillibacter sp.]